MPVRVKQDQYGTEPHDPLISIVTVVRNGEQTLEQTILSVLGQSYKKIEYIVIDGGSTDGTLDIIRRYEDKITCWISEPDSGIYDAMNKGIRRSHGALIGLLNSDDQYEDQAIQIVVDRYRSSGMSGNVVMYGNFYILDDDLGLKTEFISSLHYWKGMTVCHQTMFVSKDVYSRGLLYDTKYRYAADYDFFLKAITNNVTFINTDAFLVSFRNSGATYRHVLPINRETLAINRAYFGIWSRHYLLLMFKVGSVLMRYSFKIFITMIFGKRAFKLAKILQNRLLSKTWHDIR